MGPQFFGGGKQGLQNTKPPMTLSDTCRSNVRTTTSSTAPQPLGCKSLFGNAVFDAICVHKVLSGEECFTWDKFMEFGCIATPAPENKVCVLDTAKALENFTSRGTFQNRRHDPRAQDLKELYEKERSCVTTYKDTGNCIPGCQLVDVDDIGKYRSEVGLPANTSSLFNEGPSFLFAPVSKRDDGTPHDPLYDANMFHFPLELLRRCENKEGNFVNKKDCGLCDDVSFTKLGSDYFGGNNPKHFEKYDNNKDSNYKLPDGILSQNGRHPSTSFQFS